MTLGRALPILGAIAAIGGAVSDTRAVHLRGRILSVGFPSNDPFQQDQGFFHYRVGCWTPVKVDLTNDDGDLFNGWIEVRQPDRDGDPVVARQEVSIRDSRSYFLYIPAGRSVRDAPFNVRVFASDGSLMPLFGDRNERVLELSPGDTVRPLASSCQVILDISEDGLNHLDALAREQRLYEKLIVARCSSHELPDLVAGLEMVDVIVWDAADPTAIDLAQREAIIEWTRRGGALVLGVSKNWETVSRSAFGALLPVKLRGTSETRLPSDLPADALDLLYANRNPPTHFRPPLQYCPIRRNALLPDAFSIVPVESSASLPDENVLVAGRPCGRGRVVLVAAEMRDLFKVASYSDPFLRQVVQIREAEREEESPQSRYLYGQEPNRDVDLHSLVEEATDFDVTAGLYFLFAFGFVVAYILAATVGSWTWLKKKGLIRYSWVAFAALSVAASATSLLAVRLVRGIGNTVEAFTVVDGQAGSSQASAICYFGLKTASYSNLDLCLPGNWLDTGNSPQARAALRPRWPEQALMPETAYKATSDYLVAPIAGQLRDVLFRATAKYFEGRWEGSMTGHLEAGLRRHARNWTELTGDSWIENRLGTDLDHCYLFVAAKGFQQKQGRYRDMEIYCYPIKSLGHGKRITISAALADMRSDPKKPAPVTGLEDLSDSSQARETQVSRLLRSIAENHWASQFRYARGMGMGGEPETKLDVRSDRFTSALLLLTMFDELNMKVDAFRRLDRSQGRLLDRSTAITRDTALFVGFGNDPGPARLCWRRSGSNRAFKPIEPSASRTMYRISIPVKAMGG